MCSGMLSKSEREACKVVVLEQILDMQGATGEVLKTDASE